MLMIATMIMSKMMTTTFVSSSSSQAKISGNRSRTLNDFCRFDVQMVTAIHHVVHGHQVIEPIRLVTSKPPQYSGMASAATTT
jgi:hypothetical protein